MRLLTTGILVMGLAISGSSAPVIADAENASPEWRDVTIPAGTTLPVVLDTGVGSDISRIEAPVRAHLARPIVIGGQTVLADGSRLSGVVTDATRSGRVKGRAHVAVRFTTLTPRGDDERYRISTASVGRTAPATKKKDAITIGRARCARTGASIRLMSEPTPVSSTTGSVVPAGIVTSRHSGDAFSASAITGALEPLIASPMTRIPVVSSRIVVSSRKSRLSLSANMPPAR